MKYLRKYDALLQLLTAAAAAGLVLLYGTRGGGLKKDLLVVALIFFCIWRRLDTRKKCWALLAEVLLILLHFAYGRGIPTALAIAAAAPLLATKIPVNRWYVVKMGALSLLAAFVNFLMVQESVMMFYELQVISWQRIVLNLLCYLGACLLLFALFGSWRAAVLTVLAATVLLASANYQIYLFRGSELKPVDFLSIFTAAQVAGNYPLQITTDIVRNWVCAVLWGVSLVLAVAPEKPGRKARVAIAAAACACILIVAGSRRLVIGNVYQMTGSRENGFLLNFLMNNVPLDAPEGYEDYDFHQAELAYGAVQEELTLPEDSPNIVVIMNESYADLRTVTDRFRTDVSPYTFLDSLSENTVKGYALSPVWGGNTPNSEYEFFTGNSMAFLPNGVVSYLQYIRDDTFALPEYLRRLGYETVAMHPENPRNWSRVKVWEQLGFSERLFAEDFPREQLVREFVSDREVYQQVTECLVQNGDAPSFVFALTMQNHGGYTDPNYAATVKLEGLSGSYPEAEQYLSLVLESDRALEALLADIEALEEKTIVLFFGDHFPRLPEAFFQDLLGSDDSLDSGQKIYEVPFFFWTNYDIPAGNIRRTGLNYLAIDLLELAGIPLPAYFRFLKEVREEVPALNPAGYYSPEQEAYLPWNDPGQELPPILKDYEILEYNSIKGGKNRSRIFEYGLTDPK